MDDYYDDYDEFNDAADDWELEAAEEEEREKELLEQKAFVEEQKLRKAIKAPAKVKKEEEEEVLAADVTRALLDMQEKASSAADALSLVESKSSSGGTGSLIADMAAGTSEEAEKLGEAIAAHLVKHAHADHYNAILAVLFQDLAKEFKSRQTLTEEATKVHVASEEAKRRLKKSKKGKVVRHNDDAALVEESEANNHGNDMLNLDKITDKGGAADTPFDGDDFI